ncbi:hypothetical protein GO013_08195 [Pseudodesulfovibrio sp. JC047]|uniref:hypothetical protein n=1 Tax=Pseudodesulfovibrio sp. JC047 TaxID=2683199 RepID=UPI0013D7F973|nr:hypothetical protein [Pseudodesulfovibrio sp. JC047]NDV19397.1 hypothetical protein [Pseudodesulfovibrio sp. JC047]
MDQKNIRRIFEAYFEKYKKTEGDKKAWSAFWTEITPDGTLEINLTKCPKGTTFKIFVNKKKVAEVLEWVNFFTTMETVANRYPGLYDAEKIFNDMEFMI